MKSGGVNREEGEGLPEDSGFGCLCYQFAQKCQSTVTFFPTASPAAQPLLCNTHRAATDLTHTHCGRAHAHTYLLKTAHQHMQKTLRTYVYTHTGYGNFVYIYTHA